MARTVHKSDPLRPARPFTPTLISGATPKLGTAILQSQYNGLLRLVVEIAFGAIITNPEGGWPWTDVTSDVLQTDSEMITWTVGQQNEGQVAYPASCSFKLDNRLNLYSANNPLCSNWPNVVRNTPVRIRMSSDGGNTWYVMFQGEATGFSPTFDSTGAYVITTVEASGILRRLNQGTKPLRSAEYRAVALSTTAPLAWWPLEGATTGANQTVSFASGLANGVAMTAGVATGGSHQQSGVVSGSATGPAGSDTCADMSGGGQLAAPVSGSNGNSWSVDIDFKFNRTMGSLDSGQVIQIYTADAVTGDIGGWGFYCTNTVGASTTFQAIDTDAFVSVSNANTYDDLNWHHLRITTLKNGTGTDYTVAVDGVTIFSGTGALINPGYVTSVIIAPTGDLGAAAHLVLWNTNVPPVDMYDASTGHNKETPNARLTRLCAEGSINYSVVGSLSSVIKMGAQRVLSLVTLLREAETSDAGFLYDGLSSGLQYQGISQRLDQTAALTLDATTSSFMAPFEPVDDDLRNRNQITVSRVSGSSAVAEDDTGSLGINSIGVYDTSITVNHNDDTELTNRAYWELHSGTLAGYRVPSISLDLALRPGIGNNWMNRSDGSGPITPGARITLTNVSSWVSQFPPENLELCVVGWTMEVNQFRWNVRLNCIPNDIYNAFMVGDGSFGRLDSAGGSTVASTIVTGATTLLVNVTDDQLWTTTATFPSDFPLNVNIDGIKVTVTGIAGSSSPQTFTVTGVTKQLNAGKTVKLWKPGVISL